ANFSVKVTRGLMDKYYDTRPIGEDLTIPCPKNNNDIKGIFELLETASLGSWVSEFGIDISMGKVKSNEHDYNSCLSGKKIQAYKIIKSQKYKLVVNKILPNSNRKIKAALVPSSARVNESLVEITCKNEEVLMYLFLMLNSKFVEGALRALMSNINLNIFRLLSLPIPKPNAANLKKAASLFAKIDSGIDNPNVLSMNFGESIYALQAKTINTLNSEYADHNTNEKAVAA
ncbi:MAG: hypothetical protein Q7U04_02885, partial [Bacteriovorax sp.]|nr:hypothetical protein [Bacteriovorax sp.]